ncbi:hypothetical protein EDB19DRAFT_1832479 [Suillus lakei]|nr:hypothetical protein EDB19DRAFT_1832479 [Suillus lakei]
MLEEGFAQSPHRSFRAGQVLRVQLLYYCEDPFLQLLRRRRCEVSFVEVLNAYRHTATHSHLGMAAAALLQTVSFMMWGVTCVVLSLHVLGHLLKRRRWLFRVTDEAVDILLLSQVSYQLSSYESARRLVAEDHAAPRVDTM